MSTDPLSSAVSDQNFDKHSYETSQLILDIVCEYNTSTNRLVFRVGPM